MIVAMIAMLMMQAAGNEIVRMVAMGYCLVTAAGSVFVAGLVSLMSILRCAAIRVAIADFDHVLIDVRTLQMMQVAVMQVVYMVVVLHGNMAAAGTVMMRVIAVSRMVVCRHRFSLR
jgi:hypothetical protein